MLKPAWYSRRAFPLGSRRFFNTKSCDMHIVFRKPANVDWLYRAQIWCYLHHKRNRVAWFGEVETFKVAVALPDHVGSC